MIVVKLVRAECIVLRMGEVEVRIAISRRDRTQAVRLAFDAPQEVRISREPQRSCQSEEV
jgi:sRNA-binding carbon storage regulator CsrA